MFVCVCVCVSVCVCVFWGKGAVVVKQSQAQSLLFIYLEMNKIQVLNNIIQQAKSSSTCFRMMMRSSNNEYDLNDME